MKAWRSVRLGAEYEGYSQILYDCGVMFRECEMRPETSTLLKPTSETSKMYWKTSKGWIVTGITSLEEVELKFEVEELAREKI